jgi:FkbM family methyltransferase
MDFRRSKYLRPFLDGLKRASNFIEKQEVDPQEKSSPTQKKAFQYRFPIDNDLNKIDLYLDLHFKSLEQQVKKNFNDQNFTASKTDLARNQVFTTSGHLILGWEFDLLVGHEDTGLLAFLLRHGVNSVEPGVMRVLTNNIKSGDRVVDVGANIGIHSLVMASRVGHSGELVAFEPSENVSAILKKNLRLNNFHNRSEVFSLVVGKHTGTASFFESEHSPNSTVNYGDKPRNGTVIEKQASSLDDFFKTNPKVDFLKIDVEGEESSVLFGGIGILEANPGIKIVLEWSNSHFSSSKTSPADLFDYLENLGFYLYKVDNEIPYDLTQLTREESRKLEGANVFCTRGKL